MATQQPMASPRSPGAPSPGTGPWWWCHCQLRQLERGRQQLDDKRLLCLRGRRGRRHLLDGDDRRQHDRRQWGGGDRWCRVRRDTVRTAAALRPGPGRRHHRRQHHGFRTCHCKRHRLRVAGRRHPGRCRDERGRVHRHRRRHRPWVQPDQHTYRRLQPGNTQNIADRHQCLRSRPDNRASGNWGRQGRSLIPRSPRSTACSSRAHRP